MVAPASPVAFALVALGGGVGAALRHAVTLAAARMLGTAFPWGTLAVNVAGSLAMGALAALLLDRSGPSRATLLLMTGALGGFTTFSAYSLDVVRLLEAGATGRAALYAGASVALSVGALWVGLAIGRAA